VVTVDVDAPVVTLTAPASGAIVSGIVHMTATAGDNVAVTKVEFYDGVVLIGSELDAPYTQSWNADSVAPGLHTLFARAYDGIGNTTDSAPVLVTVPGKPDTSPPTVSITSPVKNAVIGAGVIWTALATDNVGVTRVDFYDGSTMVKSLSSGPFSFAWNTTNVAAGTHKLTVRAFDAKNSTTSAAVTITIDHTTPSVALTSPSNGAKVSGNVNIAASASDNVAVGRVEFSVAGVVRCSDASAPYSCPWTVPSGSGKTYALQAKAFDTAGNSRSTAVVTVTAR
jgi:hypothetical protein